MLKYRHTTLEDLPRIEEWIAADPSHRNVMKASDFVLIPDEKTGELPKGRQCIEVQDDKGTILFVGLKQALILEVQFPPIEGDPRAHKVRIARALEETVKYFCFAGKKLGHYVMFYESISSALIQFGEKYLGFRKADNFHKVDL